MRYTYSITTLIIACTLFTAHAEDAALTIKAISPTSSSAVLKSPQPATAADATVSQTTIASQPVQKPADTPQPAPKKAPLIISSEDEAIPTKKLVEMLKTNDVEEIIDTIDLIAVYDTGSKNILDAFVPLLQHTNVEVREAVIDCVFGFDTVKPLLPALAKCLYDPEETIRDDAIDVIADVETRDMITILVENMTNKYTDVRENCDFYLSFWTDQEFKEPEQWFAWWASNRTTFVFE